MVELGAWFDRCGEFHLSSTDYLDFQDIGIFKYILSEDDDIIYLKPCRVSSVRGRSGASAAIAGCLLGRAARIHGSLSLAFNFRALAEMADESAAPSNDDAGAPKCQTA